jgi:predicted esterase
MKNIQLFIYTALLFLLLQNISHSQNYCIPGRFDTNYYFSPLQIDTLGGITYGRNTSYLGDSLDLKLLIAYPKFLQDPLLKRPFILLIHGGGFMNGSMYDMKPLMIDLATRGYVCASIDYRLGWETGNDPYHCTGTGYSLVQAIYRAMQDSKAAFRFFSANASIYRIDTAYMFSGGISSGAVIGLHIAYATQANINAIYPNLVNELGRLDSASNTYRNLFRIKCVLSSSGGIFDTSFIKQNDAVATLMFHGTADSTVPYMTGYAYNCPNYIQTEGSGEITKRFRTLIKPFELDYVPGGGHENFYTLEYIQRRTVLFLKRYLCNDFRQVIIENYTTILDTNLGLIIPVITENESLPEEYVLFQNYPNPFNPTTNIKYDLPKNSFVKLVVYDALGREVEILVNEKQSPGNYEATFNASQNPSGVYFYRLTTDGFSETKRMILIK